MEQRLPIFAERFCEVRGERSNTEFADFLGISRQTVGFYCNGDRIPDALLIRDICKRCSVSADWLVGLSDEKALNKSELEYIAEINFLTKKLNDIGAILNN